MIQFIAMAVFIEVISSVTVSVLLENSQNIKVLILSEQKITVAQRIKSRIGSAKRDVAIW